MVLGFQECYYQVALASILCGFLSPVRTFDFDPKFADGNLLDEGIGLRIGLWNTKFRDELTLTWNNTTSSPGSANFVTIRFR